MNEMSRRAAAGGLASLAAGLVVEPALAQGGEQLPKIAYLTEPDIRGNFKKLEKVGDADKQFVAAFLTDPNVLAGIKDVASKARTGIAAFSLVNVSDNVNLRNILDALPEGGQPVRFVEVRAGLRGEVLAHLYTGPQMPASLAETEPLDMNVFRPILGAVLK